MAQLNDLLVTGASRLLNGLGILGSTNADSILPNTTDTYDLGSSSKRWNVLYAKTSNIDTETVGTLTVTNYATIGANQAATGTGTGALRVSGGISATQNSWFGKNIIMTPTNGVGIKIGVATITSASTTNGEIVLQNGHLRFGTNDWDYDKWAGLKYDATNKIIYLGLADKTVFAANSAQSGGTLALPGVRYISLNGKIAFDGNDSWLRINESKTFSSGTYFGQSIVRTDNQFQVGDGGNKFYANSSGNGYFSNTLGVGGTNTNYKIYTNGKTKVGDGANSTSASTGGLQVAGGIGVSGNSWFGGTVTATKFIGPLQGNADSSTTLQGWAPKHFYNEFIGGKWYHINMNNTSSDRTGFYKVADIVLTSGYGTYTAAKIVGYLYDHNGNWEQTETYIMPFQAIINITDDVAYLYSNVLANSEHLRIVKTAVRTYELQARCNSTHTDFDVFYQVIGTAGVTPYETLVTGSTTGTVIGITQTQSWGNTAYKASILANTRTFTIGNTSKNFNGSSNVSWTLGEIGAATANHTHGLLHSNFNKQIDNTTTDSGWSMINSSYNGFMLMSLRTQANAPAWIQNNYAAGVAFGGADTKGVFSVAYNAPLITIAGGNGSKPTWYIKFSGTSAKTYNLDSMLTTANYSTTLNPIYVNVSGDTMTGALNVGGKVELWSDSEGGNIRLTSPNGSLWSIDALNNTSMRFIWAETSIPFSFSNDGTITGNYFTGTAAYANSTAHYGNNALRSQRDFADGTLITTDLDGGTTNSSIPFLLEIKGNGYSTNTPLFVQAQGYVYMLGNGYSSYINVGGQAIGTFASYIYAFKDSNGKLAFWFPRVSYWQGFDVFCWNCSEGINTRNLINHVTSVSNSALPNSRSYTTTINLVHIWRSGDAVTGAVWNDYAECRESDIQEPGYVLIEKGDDTLTKSTERMQPFAGVSSDTWGFSQGETERAKTHIAVAGRVLVYPYRPRDEYKPGDCVCAAPNGTVDIMTPNEIALHPDRIVGTVSCVPTYEEWGGGELADRDPVKVNGRIWIKVR